MVETRKLTEIVIGKRHRIDMGDVAELAQSIVEIGLLHPIVINPMNELIAGARRLAAFRHLGRLEIAVTVVDLERLVTGEYAENFFRKAFTPSEIVAIGQALEPSMRQEANERQRVAGTNHGRGQRSIASGKLPEAIHGRGQPSIASGKLPEAIQGQARDAVAKAAGVSGRTYEKAKAVVDAAKCEPEKFQPLVKEMDETGKVDRAFKELKRLELAESRQETVHHVTHDLAGIHQGDFRVLGTMVGDETVDLIFTDPPYDEDSVKLYGDLAAFAARVLRPGGWCLAYTGQSFLPDVLQEMKAHLTYGWTFAVKIKECRRIFKFKLNNNWKPIVGFYKPPLQLWWINMPDMVNGEKEKSEHEWQQPEIHASHFMSYLSPEGGLICDPMTGSGTTCAAAKQLRRQWIGFESDRAAVDSARARLKRLEETC